MPELTPDEAWQVDAVEGRTRRLEELVPGVAANAVERFNGLWTEAAKDSTRARMEAFRIGRSTKAREPQVLEWWSELYEVALHEALRSRAALPEMVAAIATPETKLTVGVELSQVPRPPIQRPREADNADYHASAEVAAAGTEWFRIGSWEEELLSDHLEDDSLSFARLVKGLVVETDLVQLASVRIPLGCGTWPVELPGRGAHQTGLLRALAGPIVMCQKYASMLGVQRVLALSPVCAVAFGLGGNAWPGPLELAGADGRPAVMACSPKPAPVVMRVIEPLSGRGETLDVEVTKAASQS